MTTAHTDPTRSTALGVRPDGDGLLGTDEDNDGDQVFGTINAAVGTMNGSPGNIADNGQITIVTSGRFLEQVNLAGTGVEILQAAPGVEAVVEAFHGRL